MGDLMKQRQFGRLGWRVSEVGFGGWGIGRTWWGSVEDKDSIRALRLAWDKGVNFFDTAYVYGNGHSEKLMAKALRGKPAFIATKIPPKDRVWPGKPGTPVESVFPASWITACTERSLKYLKRDSIDLTQFHVWSDAWLKNDEWQAAIFRLKQQGKIRGFGVSINDHQPSSALKLVESGLVDSVQVIFNIFDQTPAQKLLPLCAKKNVAVIVRVPFDEGGLSGTLTDQTQFEPGDFRRGYFRGGRLAETVRRADRIKLLLNKRIHSLPNLALRFVLDHPAVSVVIPGMRQPHHVQANVSVSDGRRLEPAIKRALKKFAWKRNFYGQWE
jgi:aryl-alcohol dehydrogenase-like predicted oxidoreductase